MRKAHPSFYDQDFRRIDVRRSGDIGYWAIMLTAGADAADQANARRGISMCAR
jgi:hypothetical protein